MQEATISGEQPKQQQSLYQRGKYPSIVDTDDLVFEMGIQLVGNLNKEKLLDKVVGKARETEAALVIAEKAKKVAEDKVAPLKLSNEQYIQNNQKLDAELVKVRKELETTKQDSAASKKETEAMKVAHLASAKQYEEKIAEIKTAHEKDLADMTEANDEKIAELKKRKAPKKKGVRV